jgi:hypothetical protein
MLRKYGVPPQAQPLATSPPAKSPTPSSSSKKTAEAQQNTEEQKAQSDTEANADHPEQSPAAPQPDLRTIRFLKGKLVAVDCSQAPTAILTVTAGAKALRLRTENYKSLTIMGADDFSCEWKNRSVAVNYRAGGKADGDLVSVEVQ